MPSLRELNKPKDSESSLKSLTAAVLTVAACIGDRRIEESPISDAETIGRTALAEAFTAFLVAIAQQRQCTVPALVIAQFGCAPPRTDDISWFGSAVPKDLTAEMIGDLYESLLDWLPIVEAGQFAWQSVARRRRAAGSYFTPAPLIDCLLDHSLDPMIESTPEEALTQLRICDPACGGGRFLLAVGRRIAAALQGSQPWPDSPQGAFRTVSRCLYGVDHDQFAVAVCRAALWWEGAEPDASADNFHVREGDGLLASLPSESHGEGQFGDWSELFPDVYLPNCERGPGFDLVLGNPPFSNAIEAPIDELRRDALRRIQPHIGGTADLAYRFLERACRLVRKGGAAAMVQPRAVFNAAAMRRFREHPSETMVPRMLFASTRGDWFRGASVYVGLVVLGPPGDCAIGRGAHPQSAVWRRSLQVGANWWFEIATTDGNRPPLASRQQIRSHRTLADEFEVRGSMTAAEAYETVPLLTDDRHAAGPKFITTGLIDPNECLWGIHRCRYLKRDFDHPRFSPNEAISPRLARRLQLSARPKVLVAGLSARIECLLDEAGECMGAVSTYTITHPADDVARLRLLQDALLSDSAEARFLSHLGGHALGGGNITMRKSFLREFPWSAEQR